LSPVAPANGCEPPRWTQAWENPENVSGQSAFGNSGCVVSGGPECGKFTVYTPFVTAIVPTPRVVGIEFNYTFNK
jgi:hypothetical protein